MDTFAAAVLDWHDRSGRRLPWRNVDDPYLVLVSEIMLQQTQVSRVLPIFTAFVKRFPTVAALAAAPPAEVVQAWQGLGYNRRAIALHRAAKTIVAEHGGRVPEELDELLSLPGIGTYTARALQAFAFGRDAAPVDTNVARVVSRGIAGRPVTGRALQTAADAAVPAGRGRDWSAALMDLGSSHCTARPKCDTCPVRSACAWVRNGGDDPSAAAAPRRQAPFAGSTRYHRGRLLDALRAGAVPREAIAGLARLDDPARAALVADGLVVDGLAEWNGDDLRLPV